MMYSKNGDEFVLRLIKGEELISSVLKFCTNRGVESAFISGIGSVERVELGFYNLSKREYLWKNFDLPMEIVSLTGNITQVELKPFAHIHAVLSDSEFATYGGHVKLVIIGATCEVVIRPFENVRLERNFDESTGLKLLSYEGQIEEN